MTAGKNKAVAGNGVADGALRAAAATAEPAEGPPPRLTGGDQQKPNPMSVEQNQTEHYTHFLSDGKGRLIEVPLRRGKQDGVFIDWISITFHEDTLVKIAGHPLVSDNEYMWVLSQKLEEILGFGITHKCKSKGNKFYNMMFRLGSESADYGEVHYGGQRDTVLIELKGLGCNLASDGWENRFFDFLQNAIRPRITRCDLALDFFDGGYSPEQALLDHDNGFFDNHNMRPKSEMIGSAWRREDGTGKTFYVGRKKNAKFVRVYEKGRQLGDKESNWCRFEIQFNHGDIEIPLDILKHSGGYFSGAFPICRTFKNMSHERRISVREKTLNLTFGHKVKHGKNAVGALMRFMRDVGLDDGQIVEMLIGDDGKYPKGLEPARYDVSELFEAEKYGYLHNSPEAELSRETDEYIGWKTSDEFNPMERLVQDVSDGAELRRQKEDDAYEAWLSRVLDEGLPIEKQLAKVEIQAKQLEKRIAHQNGRYKYSLAYFINHRRKAVNTIKSFNCELIPERKQNHV